MDEYKPLSTQPHISSESVKKILAYAITRINHPFADQSPFGSDIATSNDILERAANWKAELKEYEDFKTESAALWELVSDGVAIARDEETGVDVTVSTDGIEEETLNPEHQLSPIVTLTVPGKAGPMPRGTVKPTVSWAHKSSNTVN